MGAVPAVGDVARRCNPDGQAPHHRPRAPRAFNAQSSLPRLVDDNAPAAFVWLLPVEHDRRASAPSFRRTGGYGRAFSFSRYARVVGAEQVTRPWSSHAKRRADAVLLDRCLYSSAPACRFAPKYVAPPALSAAGWTNLTERSGGLCWPNPRAPRGCEGDRRARRSARARCKGRGCAVALVPARAHLSAEPPARGVAALERR